MLTGLTIKNVVLIDQLTIDFKDGLCVLTGETGAGKSILLDSMGLALGVRADSGLIRKGEDQASVSAVFKISDHHPALFFLEEHGLEGDSVLILRRNLKSDGRSQAFVNDQPVSISLLKQLGSMLLEIHGQFDTQALLNPATHRGLLDGYGVAEEDLKVLSDYWHKWKQSERELIKFQEMIETAKAEETYLRQAVEDLDALDPIEGEEDKLVSLRDRLMRREQIAENLKVAQSGVDEAENVLSSVWKALDRIGEDGKGATEALDRASAEIEEVRAELQNLSHDLSESEYSLQEIDDRLFALKAQARKHQCQIDDLAVKRNELAQALNDLETQDDRVASLSKETQALKNKYVGQAEKLRLQRRKAAKELDKAVMKELSPLKLDKAVFSTFVKQVGEENWGPYGMDRVQFRVATNPGAEPGPLNKIASGGEMSRFMLAIKVVMAEVGFIDSLVFDEVDSGVGGSTAAAVGERLAQLARSVQVLVVTHSPQVAAKADHHWIVVKKGSKNILTSVTPLTTSAERREEIARMLSGSEISEEARAAADKLLEVRAA